MEAGYLTFLGSPTSIQTGPWRPEGQGYSPITSTLLLLNILTLSPSATSHIFSSVTGLIVGNVLPLTESTYSLLINSCQEKKEEDSATGMQLVPNLENNICFFLRPQYIIHTIEAS